MLDLLPPPCAGDPRRSRYAAKLVARSLRGFEALSRADAGDALHRYREWLDAAERLAQRAGGEPSLAHRLEALREAIRHARRRLATAEPQASGHS